MKGERGKGEKGKGEKGKGEKGKGEKGKGEKGKGEKGKGEVASGRARVFYEEMHLHWPVTGAVAYVTSRLLWDPRQDVDALLDEYCAGLFGPAARAMRDYHDAVESGYERWREEVGIPHPDAKDVSSITGGGSETQFRVLNLAEADRARAALAWAATPPGLDARQAERIALVRAMFDLQALGVRRY